MVIVCKFDNNDIRDHFDDVDKDPKENKTFIYQSTNLWSYFDFYR